jgi:hypothetical protein
MASVKLAYAASSALTQTNLDGIASSSTWVAGWTSDYIDNSSNLYDDYIVNVQIQVESSGLSAGEIRVYYYRELSDSAAYDVFSAGTEGTEGTATIHDTEVRDAAFALAGMTVTDTTASRVYAIPCRGPKEVLGATPRKWAVFITQSTGTTLETTGDPNVVHIKGVYYTVA